LGTVFILSLSHPAIRPFPLRPPGLSGVISEKPGRRSLEQPTRLLRSELPSLLTPSWIASGACPSPPSFFPLRTAALPAHSQSSYRPHPIVHNFCTTFPVNAAPRIPRIIPRSTLLKGKLDLPIFFFFSGVSRTLHSRAEAPPSPALIRCYLSPGQAAF